MGKIDAILEESGFIRCYEDCVFKDSCANHFTSDSYRLEEGFTPELSLSTLNPDDIFCETINAPVDESLFFHDPYPMGILGYGAVTHDFESLFLKILQ